jgi:hypothetical protein
MMKKHIILVFFIMIISLSEYSSISVNSLDDSIDDRTMSALRNSYLSIYNLEKIGGDINVLVNLLDDALSLYHNGLKFVQIEDYDNASLLFRESIVLSNEIINISNELSVMAVNIETKVQRDKIMTNVIISLIIILIGLITWKIFKNKYMDDLMKLKVVIPNNEN